MPLLYHQSSLDLLLIIISDRPLAYQTQLRHNINESHCLVIVLVVAASERQGRMKRQENRDWGE